MRAVLDTNVLVSGIAKWKEPRSAPPQIMHLWDAGAFKLGISASILRELEFALSKPFFQTRTDRSLTEQLIDRLRTKATRVEPPMPIPLAAHWQDDLIIATAVEFAADYLVTGDKELLAVDHPFRFRIVHPNDFLAILQAHTVEEG